ncbi:MAG TPA: hypothetical protein EYO93_00905 [Nitrososphaerales archaeon]|nr:hypothetical protein [Nitrososphaerales archaeon]
MPVGFFRVAFLEEAFSGSPGTGTSGMTGAQYIIVCFVTFLSKKFETLSANTLSNVASSVTIPFLVSDDNKIGSLAVLISVVAAKSCLACFLILDNSVDAT